MSDRIELETQYTFLERTVTELSEVIYAQQKQLDFLEKKVAKLSDQLEELNGGSGESLPHLKPPHY